MARQNMKLPDSFDLTPKAAHKLEQLRLLAVEHQTICQQAPEIWDGETVEDVRMAKRGCNGEILTKKSKKQSTPCPIRSLCLETAIATQSHYGVWGGLAAHERRSLRRRF